MPKSSPIPGRKSSPDAERQQRERGVKGASVEVIPPKKRRRFSASEKLRLVKAAEAAVASGERGALGALLRKEGIYGSHLSTWRKQLGARGVEGLTARKPGRKPKLDSDDPQHGGTVAIRAQALEFTRTLWVTLEAGDYALVVQAHKDGQLVRLTGELKRERRWLLRTPRDVQIVPLDDAIA